jgi:hypothetical protein
MAGASVGLELKASLNARMINVGKMKPKVKDGDITNKVVFGTPLKQLLKFSSNLSLIL